MGMGFPFGSANRAEPETSGRRIRLGTPRALGDPNPYRFEFLRLQRFGSYCVAEVIWPDAKNFDGRKVAVYRATTDQLRKAKRLDPHFQEATGPLVPVARFEPTGRGWELACFVADHLADG